MITQSEFEQRVLKNIDYGAGVQILPILIAVFMGIISATAGWIWTHECLDNITIETVKSPNQSQLQAFRWKIWSNTYAVCNEQKVDQQGLSAHSIYRDHHLRLEEAILKTGSELTEEDFSSV